MCVRTGRHAHGDGVRGAGRSHVGRRVAHVDGCTVLDERFGLPRAVAPSHDDVDVQAHLPQTQVRVGLVLRRDHDRAAAGPADRLHRLERARQREGARHPELGVELPVPVGDVGDPVGGEPFRHLDFQSRAEPVHDDVGVDGDARLGRQRMQRRGDPRPRVDQRHVEVEADHHGTGHAGTVVVTRSCEGAPMPTRARVVHRCTECGAEATRWLGRCPECGSWGTLTEAPGTAGGTALTGGGRSAAGAVDLTGAPPVTPLADVDPLGAPKRPTGVAELDRVLGGGLVAGSVTLVGGEPGMGKSTLVLQALGRMAARARAACSCAPRSRPRRCGCAPTGSARSRPTCCSSPRRRCRACSRTSRRCGPT